MKKVKGNCDLNSCMFCRGCLPEWHPAIEANRKMISVRKGEQIFKEGDTMPGMFFVYSGTFKVHKKWGDKELIVRFARPGDIVGHRGLGKELVFSVSATALEPSVVCFLDIEFFRKSLIINTGFLYELMTFFAEELKVSERKMRNMAHMPVKGRIAGALLQLRDKFGINGDGALGISLTRQDLASYSGTTYETVFRVLNELVEAEYISITDKDISIIDAPQLEMLWSEANY